MKLEFVSPIVDSALSVLGKILQAEMRQGEIRLLRASELTGDISIIIGIQDGSGESIILSADMPAALALCGALNGTVFSVLDDVARDTLREVANMIAGNAVSILNDRGYDFKITVPTVVDGEEISLITKGLELFQVPVVSPQGEILINFTMRTN